MADRTSSAAPSPALASPPMDAGRSLRVMLAEDHDINRPVVALILEGMPVEMTIAVNGADSMTAPRSRRSPPRLNRRDRPLDGSIPACAIDAKLGSAYSILDPILGPEAAVVVLPIPARPGAGPCHVADG